LNSLQDESEALGLRGVDRRFGFIQAWFQLAEFWGMINEWRAAVEKDGRDRMLFHV